MEKLIIRAKDIKEAINVIVAEVKELASILMQDEDFTQIVFTKDGDYEVKVLATPEGEFIVETKILEV